MLTSRARTTPRVPGLSYEKPRGDGRGNANPPEFGALEVIARRARDVVWLTPEFEKYWAFGASDMEGYAELCDRVEVVRDLDGLESVAGNVLMPRRRR